MFLSTVTQVFAEERPRVRLQRIQTESMAASAKAMETGEADLAVVRSDIAMPGNGLTVAIFRRDNLVLIVPAHSRIDSFSDLRGKKIGLLRGALTEQDEALERLLDRVLNFYSISPNRVARVLLTVDDAGSAVANREVAGLLALGPSGPGPIAKAIKAITHATKAPPELVGDKQAEAIAKTIPGAEPNEIEEGAFGGASPLPAEALHTVAVTYRLVAKHSMPNFVAGEIARMLSLAKTRLMKTSPVAQQIEAPDNDDGSGLAVHPGTAAFFNGEEESLVDSATNILYLASIILGIFGSGLAWLIDTWKSPASNGWQEDIERLVAIMREGKSAGAESLDRLDDEIDGIVSRSLIRRGSRPPDADRLNSLAIAIRQAKLAVEKRRNSLQSEKS